MPGPVMHVGAIFTCMHVAPATVQSFNTRVFVSGLAAATAMDVYSVKGCMFTLPGPKPSPCLVIEWQAPATRVTINGQPAILATSVGIGVSAEQAKQGFAVVNMVQPRVVAT
jgi:hypothetical protein